MSCAGCGSERARICATCAREKIEENTRLEYGSKESKRRRKKEKKKVPYKVAVSRIKLGLLNDFEPRPAVAPLGWGKKWGPGFYRMKA